MECLTSLQMFVFCSFRSKGRGVKNKWPKTGEKTRFGGTLGSSLLDTILPTDTILHQYFLRSYTHGYVNPVFYPPFCNSFFMVEFSQKLNVRT